MYVCEHTDDPLQSTFRKIQSLTLTMPVIVDVYQVLLCCQSTYFMLQHHASNGLIALFTCFTQVLPYQTYCLLDPNTKVESFMCVQYTLLAQHCMAWTHAYVAISIHPPWERPPPDHYWLLLPFLVTINSCLHSRVVAISCPPHVLLAICFCRTPAY